MSFLDKIGLKQKKDSDADVPPPPPAPGKKKEAQQADENKKENKDMDLPPLPKQEAAPAQKKQIRDLPNRSPETPSSEDTPEKVPEQESAHAPENQPAVADNDVPPPPKLKQPAPRQPPQQRSGSGQAPSPQPESSPASKTASREDLRKAFDDVPPIKSSQNRANTKITNDDIKNFQVDNMVLPEEKNKPSPDQPAGSSSKSPSSHQQRTKSAGTQQEEKPLFVDVSTYEAIQKRIRDLKRQVGAAGSHINDILKEREEEDKEFKKFVEELERIQDDLITIDEELFEEK